MISYQYNFTDFNFIDIYNKVFDTLPLVVSIPF